MEKIKLGISSCLLGENVRYDGGHKLDQFLKNTWGEYVEYVPVCPESECGLGVPREVMHLKGDPASPRLITTHTGQDMTRRMMTWAQSRVIQLEKEALCGFIFKSDSPNCGIARIKIYNENTMLVKKGMGIFAGIFMVHFPLLPVEDEERLNNPVLRENFVERIFTLKRWRKMLKKKRNRRNLIDFHTKHKLLTLAHSPRHYQRMEKLVSGQENISLPELIRRYQVLLLESLELKTTPQKNTNVLLHIMDYFKKRLSAGEKKELLEVISHYQKGYLPLVVSVTLFNRYVRKYDQPYLKEQIYLNPHPLELQLRSPL
jgi:uncharacterized protein YbgA (DUF1722 family)/uncharacterized protein YbbK (DUF523 family)